MADLMRNEFSKMREDLINNKKWKLVFDNYFKNSIGLICLLIKAISYE